MLVLHARDIVTLQLVAKHFFKTYRDNNLWKDLCLDNSLVSEAARRFQTHDTPRIPRTQEPTALDLRRAVHHIDPTLRDHLPQKDRPTRRAVSSWDPAYPGEKVDWYNEYIARHAPLSISWLQQPTNDSYKIIENIEPRGLGLLQKDGHDIVIAPLDDGSVCLWNIGRDDAAPEDKDGRIMTRSRPGLLSVTGPGGTTWQSVEKSRAKMTSTGVVECVSIDKMRNKAYFAVQSGLNEVDLSTLQISAYDRYPFSISALSEAAHPVPLTVGTTLSLHMHDPRLGNNGSASSYTYISERVDSSYDFANGPMRNDFHRLNAGDDPRPEYATLYHPAPLSILHLNPSSTIYVAGRFPSILSYDRRFFPKLTSTIHSGARLCSMTSLITPNNPTLVAAGEYNGKGSLEFYPTTPSTTSESTSPATVPGNEPKRNRTSASSSKLLSLTSHGTRLLFSDGDGQLKWVERDGSTLVRRWNINTYTTADCLRMSSIFNSNPNEGDVARKLLPVSAKERSEVLIWTGEKIGLLGFRENPRFVFGADGDDDKWIMDGRNGPEGMAERDYGRVVREALERQADEARFMQGLGLRASA